MPWRGKSAALCQAESLTYFRVQQRARIACRRDRRLRGENRGRPARGLRLRMCV